MEEQGNGIGEINGTEVTIDTNASSPFEATGPVDGNAGADNTVVNPVADAGTDATWQQSSLPVKVGFWGKVKAFLFQEINVELTPKQQKVEDELNTFLFQEIHFFGKKKK